jgi:hypothetical protein
MSVWDSMAAARVAREDSGLHKLPPQSAVSLTFCNRGENNPGMQKIGGEASQLVTGLMLDSAKLQWEAANAGESGVVSVGECEMYDLGAMVKGEVQKLYDAGTEKLTKRVVHPEVEDAKVLVLRGFAQRLLGEDACDHIEHELQTQYINGKLDKKKLSRQGKVENKPSRWNNVLADFDQEPDIARGKGTVLKMSNFPFINALNAQAAMWMQQDNSLVCEQNLYYDVHKGGQQNKGCGIGWHGDTEREIVMGYRAGEATKHTPLLFQAFFKKRPLGPKTTITLRRGDAYIMSSKAVGKDWKKPSLLTWRHAAGKPGSCVNVKDKPTREQVAALKGIAKK